ncbi:group II intron maturase-specific domain-containing protein [Streptomyces sp. NPDC086835]|uniref:group II intron maturase-specific domain-containing protein n=1 Tax=Streptomyces sp. NPDC086835 TaxID=3365761 RepID=UPI003810EA69
MISSCSATPKEMCTRSGPGWWTGWTRGASLQRGEDHGRPPRRGSTSCALEDLHGSHAEAVLRRLIPIVRGWSTSYRAVASSTAFSSLDHYMWRLTFKWPRRRHCRQFEVLGRRPVLSTVPPSRRDHGWSATATAAPSSSSHAWTGIVRHQLVTDGRPRTAPR